jgi:molybdate transport system substrate-binding protein
MKLYLVTILVALNFCSQAAAANADELVVMISGGYRSSYDAILPAFEKASGMTVRTLQSPSMGETPEAIPNRLARGEDDDVLIMVGPALDDLIKKGLAKADTKVDIATSMIGVAVKAGAPHPDISTPDHLREALLAAKSVAYSDSASGVYLASSMFKTLGIETEMATKARKIPGTPVGDIVAQGKAELGFQQVAELLAVPGVDFIGRLPPAVQLVTTYSAAVSTHSKHPEQALALVRFLDRPDMLPILKRMGLDAPPAH